ncbi:ankyrin repeat-containing domain protein [Haematococcus lacustris]
MSFYLAEQAPAPYTVRSHGLVAPREPRATFPRGTVHHAAECGDVEAVQRHVQQGASQGYPASVVLQSREDVLGMLPLHIAAERGHLELLKYLLANQVDIDAGDKFRVTALHLASIQGHLECVRLLLQHRAAVQAVDTEGDTALHWAATKGHTEVVVLLGKHGAAVDAVNSKGWTPLHRAVYNGRRECSEQLVRQGAALTATTADGNTALHLAAFMNQLSVMETLLSLGAAPTPLNARQQSPLQLCITEAAREIILQADPTAATILTPRPPSSSSSSSSRPASHPPPASGQASGAAGAARGPRAGSGPDAYLPDVSAQMQNMQLAEVLRSRASRGEQFPDSPTGEALMRLRQAGSQPYSPGPQPCPSPQPQPQLPASSSVLPATYALPHRMPSLRSMHSCG